MGDMGELFNDLREHNRQRKQGNLATFSESDLATRLTRHNEHHYSTVLDGSRLDYWPSTNKWRWKNRNYTGTVSNLQNFISRRAG